MRSPFPHPRPRTALLALLASLVALTTLASCDLPGTTRVIVGEVLCQIGQGTDPATLALTAEGWEFSAGAGAGDALNVVAYAGGDDLSSSSQFAKPVLNGLSFYEDTTLNVTEGNTISADLAGTDRSITVTYNRADAIEPKFCRVRE